ncbi:MAG TPA: tetratricopeptide repeat protein [Paraburkholderia sp.]|jgi:predicted O-linked N-acetylglucosamine transferase (SPINDLY family)|uniref:O-linked N-acetylglucosamine transferase, SPINDLY family protein n=1 Tax=Paraburkholderia sp. TaxID=1926495 RepID=UPI002DE6FCA7|nr:tetratricopeptide repeat protein [Paraburkholderia sp.]
MTSSRAHDPAAASVQTPALTLADALAAWHSGEHDEARRCCAQLLEANPHDADALHMAGVLELGRDNLAARTLIERALALREDPHFLVNFALTFGGDVQTDRAIAALNRALALQPDFTQALNNLANLYDARGERERAVAMLERVVALDPAYSVAHYNYGSLLLALGDLPRAEAELRRAIELDPRHIGAWNNLANVFIKANHRSQALALLEHACTFAPDSVDLLTNLGSLLRHVGRVEEARSALERALALSPGQAGAWNNYGNVLVDQNDADGALDAFARAIALRPTLADVWANYGNALKAAGDIDAALDAYRRAVDYQPDNSNAHSNLVFAGLFATEDGMALRVEAERYAACHDAPYLAVPARHANVPDPSRRLRIGYVSPDFRTHCQALFTLPVFAQHDHAAFEIFAYSSAQPDAVTQRLAALCDHWRDVRDLDDARLAQQIRDDGIDVLVDLTMHMANTRRALFARRPAPVQVAWLAYPGTTGSPATGWRITDPWLDPLNVPGIDEQYSERSLRLPDAFWCYAPLEAPQPVSALPALTAGQITFGCLNNPCKLTDGTFAQWAPVLAALPDSRLVLMAPPGSARERILAKLAAHDIDAGRVRFVGFQAREDYLRTWAQVDIALDTFPANGHTTSLDAFWMGVPVPTRVGRVAAGRGGLSLLANLGLLELAAHDDAQYAEIVIALARDLPRLAALHASLRARLQASPLMDAPRFARNMEAAYRLMWRDWCERRESDLA